LGGSWRDESSNNTNPAGLMALLQATYSAALCMPGLV